MEQRWGLPLIAWPSRLRPNAWDLVALDSVLGVLALVARDRQAAPDAEEQRWLDERAAARAARDFAQSDHLRVLLASRGLEVEDTPQGQRWKRISPRRG